jgi:hypothetical protein
MAPVAAVLARTEETVVAVTGIRAYPAGFGFTLALRLRNLPPRERRAFWPFEEFSHRRGRERDDGLRLTIEFAEGRSVSNLDAPIVGADAPGPARPMLSSGPGTSMAASGPFRDRWIWDMDYRVRPLPPPGPLAFVCTWPERGTGRLASRSTARRSAQRPTPR